jgi:IPT/TIG domain/Glucose / Sorbosone dehydrogenase
MFPAVAFGSNPHFNAPLSTEYKIVTHTDASISSLQYINIGGNTNGGVPGALSKSRLLKENVMSAATLVAHLANPGFDGFLTYSKDDDGDLTPGKGVEVFASGLRNPFGMVLHSNGNLYSTDNGPNLDYGDMSVDCARSSPNVEEEDKLLLVKQGNYYGHANRKRGATDPRQCKWRSSIEKGDSQYTAPLLVMGAATCGITEWSTNHFNGQLRGNLIIAKYIASVFRVILTPDGKGLIPESNNGLLLVSERSLDITHAPSGELLEARYADSQIWYHRPVEPATTQIVVKGVWPRRGGQAGGSNLHVYGVNLDKGGKTPTVTVGGKNCPVTQVHAYRVMCTLAGGFGTVDVVLTQAGETSTFQNGYRYITGMPK